MNHSVYIFGDLGNGFSQYPDDFTKKFFQVQSSELPAATQIALHREGNLIYYSYYRRLLGGTTSNHFIGISVCFNSLFTKEVNALFSVFEQCITDLAVSGKLIEFSKDGDLLSSTDSFYLKREEIERVSSFVSVAVNRIPSSSFMNLPPVNYGADKDKVCRCALEDAEAHLPKLLFDANNILILKDKDYKSSQFVGFAKQLSDLYDSNQTLEQENAKLKNQVSELNRKKKQYRLVTFLSIIALVAIAFIIFFRQNIVELQSEVEDKENIISSKDQRIETLKSEVSKKDASINRLKKDIAEKELLISKRDSFLVNYVSSSICPIALSDIELKGGDGDYGDPIYSSSTTYVYSRMRAHSLIDGAVDILVKFYTPYGLSGSTKGDSPTGYSYSSSVTLQKNQTTTIWVSGWGGDDKGHWKSGSYRIEYWYKDLCLGTKHFTIY